MPPRRRPATPRRAVQGGRGAVEGGGQETEDINTVGGHGRPPTTDARGSVVFEVTASAAVIIERRRCGRLRRDVVLHDRRVLFAERPCSLAGWRRCWSSRASSTSPARRRSSTVYGAAARSRRGPTSSLILAPSGTDAAPPRRPGISRRVRRARRAAARNVVSSLEPGYRTRAGPPPHDATRPLLRETVSRPGRAAAAANVAAWAASYGGDIRPLAPPRRKFSPLAATPAKPACPPCEAAAAAAQLPDVVASRRRVFGALKDWDIISLITCRKAPARGCAARPLRRSKVPRTVAAARDARARRLESVRRVARRGWSVRGRR